ncbi:hypothetical protein ACQL2C_003001 [Yersinia enterocolitica]
MNNSTDCMSKKSLGKIVIAYQPHHHSPPLVINIPDVDNRKFMSIAQTIAVAGKGDTNLIGASIPKTEATKGESSFLYANIIGDRFTKKSRSLDEEKAKVDNQEEPMSDFNRSELQAHLQANKAEVDAVAASMKKDMAEWREQSSIQLANLNASIQILSAKIDGKLDSVDGDVKSISGKFEGIQGQMAGLNTAIGGIQSGISTRLAIFGVIIALVVAIPGILSALATKEPLETQLAQPAPIIIQVPTAIPAPPQLIAPPKNK